MNKYRIIGLAAAAVAAAAAFGTYYFSKNYGPAFAVIACCFAVMGTSELMIAKNKNGSRAVSYMRPVFFYITAVCSLVAAVWMMFV